MLKLDKDDVYAIKLLAALILGGSAVAVILLLAWGFWVVPFLVKNGMLGA